MKRLSLLSFFVIFSHSIVSQPLVLSGVETQGACVVDLSTGGMVYEYNAERLLTPASLTKVLTTAVAMKELGSEYRYETRTYLKRSPRSRTTDDQTFTLTIVGSGDPTFNSRYFPDHKIETLAENVATQLKKSGVTKIDKIVADAVFGLSPEVFNNKRLVEDIDNYYGALPHALNIYDNSFDITLKSGNIGEPCTVVSSKYPVRCDVVASATKRDSAYVYYRDGFHITGSIPSNRDKFTVRAALPDPPLVFCQELRKALIANNIDVANNIVFERNTSADTDLIFTDYSPTLYEICYQTNHHSINLFADAVYLLKHSDDFCVYDGSGLSPMNALSPRTFCDILIQMKDNSDFVNTLALSGETGTLKSFPLKDVRGKTGTMQTVTALCGYYKNYAFCIIVNHHTEKNSVVRAKMAEFLKTF